MLDITVTATTTLRLGLPEMLSVAMVPLAGWGVWKARHVLAQAVAALHRQILLRSPQKLSEGHWAASWPGGIHLMLPKGQKTPERPS